MWFPKSAPRQVAGGIQAKGKFGQTWWAKRWIETLNAFGWKDQLAHGRNYARRGQVARYDVTPGQVTAEVQGTRPSPYSVTIRLQTLSKGDWEKVIAAMADQAIFAARLLAGEMPERIEEAFEQAEVSLFPRFAGDLETACSCPDPVNPCKHVAAVHYLLGEVFDIDPFMMFHLRGMSKEQVLARLGERRGVLAPGAGSAAGPAPDDEPVAEPEPAVLPIERFWDAPPPMTFRIEKPRVDSAVLRRLGEPTFWTGRRELTVELAKSFRKASATAIKMAFAPERTKKPRGAERE